jgi:hypothetical protein
MGKKGKGMYQNNNPVVSGTNRNPAFVGARRNTPHPCRGLVQAVLYKFIYRTHKGSHHD